MSVGKKHEESPEERMASWAVSAKAEARAARSNPPRRDSRAEIAALGGAEHLPFRVDAPEVLEVLARLEESLGAKSVSLLSANADGSTLRVLGSRGPFRAAARPAAVDRKRSPAGRALESGEPVVDRTPIPQLVEDDRPARDLYRASVPVVVGDRAVAALNATIELDHAGEDGGYLPVIAQVAEDLGPVLLRIVDLAALEPELREDLLLVQLDRALANQDTLHMRLNEAGAILARAFGDACQVFLSDVAGNKLKLVTTPRGTVEQGSRFQDIRTGLLGWLVRNEGPTYLSSPDPATGILHGQLGVPVRVKNRLHSLFLVEDVAVDPARKEATVALAGKCASHIESILEVETSVEESDRSTQLRAWLADSLPMIRDLHGTTRIANILKFAAELLGGEVAVWMGAGDEEPLSGPPAASGGFDLLSRAWNALPRVSRNLSGDAGRAWRSSFDGSAPDMEIPYVAVREPRSRGVLVVLFAAAAPAPEDPESLVDLLSVLCREIDPQGDAARPEVPAAGGLVDIAALKLHLEQEWNRSLRFGHFFSLTRFATTGDSDPVLVREFLARRKRVVDILAEDEGGVFYCLTPETENDPEGVRIRLGSDWLQEHPEVPVKIDQMIFPVDGEHCDSYVEWIGAARAA